MKKVIDDHEKPVNLLAVLHEIAQYNLILEITNHMNALLPKEVTYLSRSSWNELIEFIKKTLIEGVFLSGMHSFFCWRGDILQQRNTVDKNGFFG